MAEFEISGTRYASRPMDASVQLKVMKRLARLAPALQAMIPILKSKTEPDAEGGDDPAPQALGEMDLDPLFKAFSEMPDADFDYVVHSCCFATTRQVTVGRGWVPVMQLGPRGPMFQDQNDENPSTMLLITWNVLRENFDKFFAVAKQVRADL